MTGDQANSDSIVVSGRLAFRGGRLTIGGFLLTELIRSHAGLQSGNPHDGVEIELTVTRKDSGQCGKTS